MTRLFLNLIITCVCLFPLIGKTQFISYEDTLLAKYKLDGTDSKDDPISKYQRIIGVTLETDKSDYFNPYFKFDYEKQNAIRVNNQISESNLESGSISIWFQWSPRIFSDFIHSTLLMFNDDDENKLWIEFYGSGLQIQMIEENRVRTTGGYKAYVIDSTNNVRSGWNNLILVFDNNVVNAFLNGKKFVWLVRPEPGTSWFIPKNLTWIGYGEFAYFDGSLRNLEISSLVMDEISSNIIFNSGLRNSNDFDEDGIINIDEVLNGLHPTNSDTDDDGIIDGRELEIGTSPLLVDSDDDGYDDWIELQNDTDPSSDKSSPEILEIFTSIELNFGTSEGNTYQLQYSPNLEEWIDYQDPFDGTGGKTIIHVSIKNTDMKYFRLTRVIDLNN